LLSQGVMIGALLIRRQGAMVWEIAQHGAERGLLDPFDPVQASPKAAQLLRELKEQFGNLGLAAAAYNAGPARVRDWLAGPCVPALRVATLGFWRAKTRAS
jgi:hypothetical protein